MKPVLKLSLSRGEAGTDETIAVMTAVAHDAAENSRRVQDLARRIIDDNDTEWLRIKDLYTFLRDRFVFEPDRPGVEEIRKPDSLLRVIEETGEVRADCDDRATLGAAILRAMKLPAFFIVMSRSQTRGYHHVYYGSALSVLPDRVIPCDPQAATPCGDWTPAARQKVYRA